jgi:hypothetical protein
MRVCIVAFPVNLSDLVISFPYQDGIAVLFANSIVNFGHNLASALLLPQSGFVHHFASGKVAGFELHGIIYFSEPTLVPIQE